MAYADVIVFSHSVSLDRPFLYKVPDSLEVGIGDLVKVAFGLGNKQRKGLVIALREDLPKDFDPDKVAKTKSIEEVLFSGLLKKPQLKMAEFLKERYLSTTMEAYRLLLPNGIENGLSFKTQLLLSATDLPFKTTAHEEKYGALRQYIQEEAQKGGISRSDAVKAGFSRSSLNTMIRHGYLSLKEERLDRFSAKAYPRYETLTLNEEQAQVVKTFEEKDETMFLLHGITGSGKTEVFLHLVEEVVAQGGQAIILVPEIALTPQMIQRVKGRFGQKVCVYHSRLSQGERLDEWRRVHEGGVSIAIGARSALFLPFNNPKLVVVDEEHEMSYKSETNPKFITQEVAQYLMELHQGKVLLASATPCLESYEKALSGDYQLLELKKRAGLGQLPHIHVVDMRKELRLGNRSILSQKLAQGMEESLKQKRQVILFLNRRGVSGFVSCRSCGFVYRCPNCSVSLTKHRGGHLFCHHCGYHRFEQENCPNCGSKAIKEFGIGTEKVEEEVIRRYPEAKVLRMDKDTTRTKESYEKIYETFQKGKADILIGTQMIAKGMDFHGVNLVGILAADLSMNMPDFRSYERTFQLITQVSGRCGRGEEPGQVILQTYDPQSYPVQTAQKGDFQEFFRQEKDIRKTLDYPPYGSLMAIVVSGQEEDKVVTAIHELSQKIQGHLNRKDQYLLGPNPCLLSKLKGYFRQQLLIKGTIPLSLAHEIRQLAYEHLKGKELRLSLDLNPTSLV